MKKIITIYQRKQDKTIQNFIKERYPKNSQEEICNFSFSIKNFLSIRKKINKKHDITLIQLEPPFCCIKQFFVYLLFLGLPSSEKFVFSADKEEPVKISLFMGLRLLFQVPLSLILSVFVVIAALLFLNLFKFIIKNKKQKVNLENLNNKKLLFIIPTFRVQKFFGGMLSHIQGIIEGFTSLGWDINIVTSNKLSLYNIKQYIIKPILTNFISVPALYILYDFYLTFKILNIIKKEKPSFLYQRHSIYSSCGVFLSYITGIPLILEVNALLSWEQKEWSGKKDSLTNKLLSFYENISLKGAYRIRAVSEVVKKHITDTGISVDKVAVIPNGVTLEKFCPNCGGSSIKKKLNLEDKITIGYSGCFALYHGIDTLADIIIKMTSNFNNIAFILIGDGRERLKIEDKLIDNKVSMDRVIFTGMVPQQKVPLYLDACDILISPTKKGKSGSEFHGSPTKIFEYMGMGKAIICSKLGQMAEIFEDGKDSLLVEYNNLDGFCESIEILINKPDLINKLGKAIRKKAKDQHSWTQRAHYIISKISNSYT